MVKSNQEHELFLSSFKLVPLYITIFIFFEKKSKKIKDFHCHRGYFTRFIYGILFPKKTKISKLFDKIQQQKTLYL